ncbi:unnamed protein product (macronuclear) [Paramecium tetraurelia]|uniref:Peptidase M1 leukotriene A4 hydrolase/aminopeptidase C-terminal domain-containing protein n=1 Tax=Paramecium tetraurelia TaxID=5888 RepID=A0CV66_PARTE|nr:uncharacterized protein GSPATT00010851001 [Paramecium tetraurelia]CAK74683.1 unnamed protein product [Paramecium tetraurelia]|eukprot:XP_001442080.1 hypothetical protein (macronuclear) [Paramecium tetraurelia strain d4-2]
MKLVIILLLCHMLYCVDVDKNTFSNYKDVKTQHLHIEWLLNLNDKVVDGSVEYTLKVFANQLSEVHLDIYKMNILFIYYPSNGQVLKYHVESDPIQKDEQGDKLVIELGQVYKYGEIVKFRIKYQIGEDARALSFMDPSQTDDKKAPYLFSQCEANNCRSMIPLQDTPSIKFTYSATVITQSPLINVFMSGNRLQTQKFELMGNYEMNSIANIFQFELNIKIPAYLIAIVAGTVEERSTGARTAVISESKNIQKYKDELEDLDQYVQYLEDYIGEYKWGSYKIVILPASFPFGGMENPLLTFANPTIIVGDKSGVSVAVHEIAHSWFGNTITCNNWSNMWINEGFCVFLERKGLKTLFKDINLVHVNSQVGNNEMNALIKEFNSSQDDFVKSYASLHPKTENHNADDSFSTIPYERGFQLLYYLEKQINETRFQQLLKAWLQEYEYKSADESDFYRFMILWLKVQLSAEEFTTVKKSIDNVYTKWVYDYGQPPIQETFENPASKDVLQLVNAWIEGKGTKPQNYQIFDGFKSNQKQLFLSSLTEKSKDITEAIMVSLEDAYHLSDLRDAELLFRWYALSINTKYAKDTTNLQKIKAFVGVVGRMKMVNPIYKALNKETATQWYQENYAFYHPLTRQSIESIIKSKTIIE